MTGKLVVAADFTVSKLNIGNAIGTPNPTTTVNGDVWITNGNRLGYRSNSTVYNTAATNLQNTFNQPQAFDASSATTALRVTQRGAGEALRVEDDTTPDATAFVVSNSGRVGIGVTPDAAVALSVDSTGIKFSTGALVLSGVGSPEGVVAAALGSIYTNSSGGSGATLWVKESGASTSTGWVSK